jgi:hypothetical protein
MCLRVSYKKKIRKFFFETLRSRKKGVGSGSISQRYGSSDPDSHQNLKDRQHCFLVTTNQYRYIQGF